MGFLFILGVSIAAFFWIKEVAILYFSDDTMTKAAFFLGIITLMFLIFLLLVVVKGRTATKIFIVLSLLTSVGLVIVGLLSIFGVYAGLAKIIFSWPAGLGGVCLGIFTFIMFFTNAPRLLETSLKIPGKRKKAYSA